MMLPIFIECREEMTANEILDLKKAIDGLIIEPTKLVVLPKHCGIAITPGYCQVEERLDKCVRTIVFPDVDSMIKYLNLVNRI